MTEAVNQLVLGSDRMNVTHVVLTAADGEVK